MTTEKKVSIVTGAASGMGRATAIRLAQEGHTVIVADIDMSGAEQTVELIAADNGNASPHHYDAAETQSCVELVVKTVASHGRLDVVANVAGIAGFYHLHETTTELFQRVLTINLTSVMIICREAMPHLKSTEGCVINFASINAHMPVAYHAAYDASKAGVLALTKSIAQEFAADGIRCNAICPGGFDTAMNQNMRMADNMDFTLLAKLSNPNIPMASAERVAGVVAFLASEDASYINGEGITVDGGVGSIL